MRDPLNTIPGMSKRTQSSAVSVTVDVFESQPSVSPPDATTTSPMGQFAFTVGTFTDDATRLIARTLHLETSLIPSWIKPGMWVRPTIGIQLIQPIIYRYPCFVIDDVTEPLDKFGGGALDCSDPSAVVDTRPYERDTSLGPAKLQTLVGDAFRLALSRPCHDGEVPYIDIPVGSIAEFGTGRWAACVRVAESLGYALRVNDYGDPVARDRTLPAPESDIDLEQSLLPGGVRHALRTPTDARVFVNRGTNVAPLIGKAAITDIGVPPAPSWYRPYVVTDRQEGPDWWNQGYADKAAQIFLHARLSELDKFDNLPILASPWLEAGIDTVRFLGGLYWVRSITTQFPSMATTVSLNRADLGILSP
jgi:hypothetical protein